MSIPLDRLYHFLHSLSDGDMIIYHWYPHGSRKLEDLICIQNNKDIVYRYTTPHAVFHDQEPLNYNYWSKDEFNHVFFQHYPETKSKEMELLISDLHIRSTFDCPFNLYKKSILIHSEKNSKELDKYVSNNFVDVYYWAHALISLDWFRYAQHDRDLCPDFAGIKHNFLIYNRAWTGTREYRLKMSELLVSYNLVDHCNTKFNPIDSGTHYTDHSFVNPSLAVQNTELEKFYHLNQSSSDDSATYVSEDYKCSGIEVVLETLFDDSRWHLTEKSLRPIACGRPFILASTTGSLKYLKSYGFKTFSPWINEDYDSIVDPLERLTAIVQEMQRISMLPAQEQMQLWIEIYKIAEYNKDLFFSQDWCNSIVKEFQTNLASAYNQTVNQKSSAGYIRFVELRPYSLDKLDSKRLQDRKSILAWAQEHVK
jgi:hypothetical protein